jgi:hypothetical protein
LLSLRNLLDTPAGREGVGQAIGPHDGSVLPGRAGAVAEDVLELPADGVGEATEPGRLELPGGLVQPGDGALAGRGEQGEAGLEGRGSPHGARSPQGPGVLEKLLVVVRLLRR